MNNKITLEELLKFIENDTHEEIAGYLLDYINEERDLNLLREGVKEHE
jgi:hypothetical protein